MKRLRDPRVWLGLGITALALWFAFQGVSWAELGQALARANFWLLIGVSVPVYVTRVWARAERWRVLARGVAAVPAAPARGRSCLETGAADRPTVRSAGR